ncbi:hypothetical protein CLORY_27520 [Clostridium oryzae]|uniref:Uncharacterized protein n=1 Tax=Clostridium oryzae TaxID=1450648 RepID=A0A1V4IKX1_9CLOT|nr:hypothetical protein CLORY_27520 [Clostridium oryzae]
MVNLMMTVKLNMLPAGSFSSLNYEYLYFEGILRLEAP